MSSVNRHQFLSQELLCRVSPFFVKRAKEKQHCNLEIVSTYMIHLKVTKYTNSVNKTGCWESWILIAEIKVKEDQRYAWSPTFFIKRAKEKQHCNLEIVSRYIIHLKVTKYTNSVNKTGCWESWILIAEIKVKEHQGYT